MTPEAIRNGIAKKGFTQYDLATELNKTQSAINQVIHRKSYSVNIMIFIADLLGKPFIHVWGITEDEARSRRKNKKETGSSRNKKKG
jgi:transcriptional regulator with XRE-family HTH domain